MTERLEIIGLVEQAEEVLREVAYEARTKPGNGKEFADTLLMAERGLRKVISHLKKAEAMFGAGAGEIK